MTKRDRNTLIKGVLAGLVAGAFIPDTFNPYVLFQRIRRGV